MILMATHSFCVQDSVYADNLTVIVVFAVKFNYVETSL